MPNADGSQSGQVTKEEAHIRPDPLGAALCSGEERRKQRSHVGWAPVHARHGRHAGVGPIERRDDVEQQQTFWLSAEAWGW